MVARRAGNALKVAVEDFFKSLVDGERFKFDEMAFLIGEELGVDFLSSPAEYSKLIEAAENALIDAGISDWAGTAIKALVVDGFDAAVSAMGISGGRRSVDASWEVTPEGKLLKAYVLGNRWASDRLRWDVVEASGPSFAYQFLKDGYVKSREELEWLLEYRLEAPGAFIEGAFPWEIDRVINQAKLRWGLLNEEELEDDANLRHPWLKDRR